MIAHVAGPVVETRSGKPSGQRAEELAWLLDAVCVRNVRRYLEVGARYGDTMCAVADVMAPGGVIVVVDMPNGPWGRTDSEPVLHAAADYARSLGHDVHVIIGNSHKPSVVAQVEARGPFDLGLIDADHTLAAVTQDVASFAPLCDAIVLHDISSAAPSKVDVPLLWRALSSVAPTSSFVADGSGMGLGLVECAR